MKNRIAILSLFAAFFVPAVNSKAAPQSQSNKASIAGTLTDPAGAPVAEVQVTAQPDATPAQQTTAPTDVISRETISERQAVSLPELLEFSPGIAVGRTGPFGGTASIFLNGGNSNFTKVLLDGTPINPPG